MTIGEHINRIFWLLDIIVSYGPITLKDINNRWIRRSGSMGEMIDRQAFIREKQVIEDLFGIEIVLVGRNKYKVQDSQHTINRSLQNHMLANIHESNFMNSFKELGPLISIPSVYKGSEYLSLIGEALSEELLLKLTYQKYNAEPYEVELQPYCLKLFNRRWYLFGRKACEDKIKCFSLDRVNSMDLTDTKYQRDILFDPDAFFANYFGVYMGGIDAGDVLIRTTKVSMRFLKDLPLHASQRQIDKSDAYKWLKANGIVYADSDTLEYYFKFYIAPTPDFENELLKLCENCEVLYPVWLRQKLHSRLLKAANLMR